MLDYKRKNEVDISKNVIHLIWGLRTQEASNWALIQIWQAQAASKRRLLLIETFFARNGLKNKKKPEIFIHMCLSQKYVEVLLGRILPMVASDFYNALLGLGI